MPFGVNLNLFPAARPINNDDVVEVILEEGVLSCGQAVTLIKDIPPVKELIERIVSEATEVGKKLG